MGGLPAISQSYQKENLLACTDKEVAYLLASESIVERSIDSKIHTEENIENQSESENEDLTSQTKEEALITFYSNIIAESGDLLKLSKEERNSIREIFGSEFFFIKQLKERNNK